VRITTIVTLAMLLSGSLHADWIIETLDSQGVTGYWTSIRTGSDGLLHIVYRDDTDNALMHTWQSGGDWAYEVVDNCDCWFMAMVLDTLDIPRISYWDHSGERICHVHWNASAWVTDTLGFACQSGYDWPSSDIEIDSLGRSRVVWYDGSGVNYAAQESTGIWSISVVDSVGNTGVRPSLSLDDQDIPHLAYGNIDNGHLYYASKQGEAWQIEVVDFCEYADYTSIEMDSYGTPHVLYYGLRDVSDSPVYTVGYATREASGWEIEVAGTGQYLYPSSPQGLYLDASDHPHICTLWADMGGYLGYRYKDSTGWHNETVGGPEAGYDSAICMDSIGSPNISYFYWETAEDLHWAHRSPTGIWSIETSLCTGQNILSVSPASNPIVGSASVVLNMLVPGTVSVRIYDVMGRLIYELPELELPQGTHELSIGNFGSGLYFCVAESGGSLDRTSFITLE